MSKKSEIDEARRQLQQCVRKMRPLVVEQQPERDMRFPKPVMVVQERWSRSSHQEQMEKRWIEIALAGGTSMEEIEEIRAMTNYTRPVMTPEEEKQKRLETLEECRRMLDRWDEEDEAKKQEEEVKAAGDSNQSPSLVEGSVKSFWSIPPVTESDTAAVVCVEAGEEEEQPAPLGTLFQKTKLHRLRGNKKKKKKRWKELLESHARLGSEEKKLFGIGIDSVREEERQEQREKNQRKVNHDIDACQVFDRRTKRKIKIMNKIKRRKVTRPQTSKCSGGNVHMAIEHVRKDIKHHPPKQNIKITLSGNKTVFSGTFKLGYELCMKNLRWYKKKRRCDKEYLRFVELSQLHGLIKFKYEHMYTKLVGVYQTLLGMLVKWMQCKYKQKFNRQQKVIKFGGLVTLIAAAMQTRSHSRYQFVVHVMLISLVTTVRMWMLMGRKRHKGKHKDRNKHKAKNKHRFRWRQVLNSHSIGMIYVLLLMGCIEVEKQSLESRERSKFAMKYIRTIVKFCKVRLGRWTTLLHELLVWLKNLKNGIKPNSHHLLDVLQWLLKPNHKLKLIPPNSYLYHVVCNKLLLLVTSVWKKGKIKHKHLKQINYIKGRFSDGVVKFIGKLLADDTRKISKLKYKVELCGMSVLLLIRVWRIMVKWKNRKVNHTYLDKRRANIQEGVISIFMLSEMRFLEKAARKNIKLEDLCTVELKSLENQDMDSVSRQTVTNLGAEDRERVYLKLEISSRACKVIIECLALEWSSSYVMLLQQWREAPKNVNVIRTKQNTKDSSATREVNPKEVWGLQVNIRTQTPPHATWVLELVAPTFPAATQLGVLSTAVDKDQEQPPVVIVMQTKLDDWELEGQGCVLKIQKSKNEMLHRKVMLLPNSASVGDCAKDHMEQGHVFKCAGYPLVVKGIELTRLKITLTSSQGYAEIVSLSMRWNPMSAYYWKFFSYWKLETIGIHDSKTDVSSERMELLQGKSLWKYDYPWRCKRAAKRTDFDLEDKVGFIGAGNVMCAAILDQKDKDYKW